MTQKMELVRSNIHLWAIFGLTAERTRDGLLGMYRDSTPSLSTVHYWRRRFKAGKESVEDAWMSGRPHLNDNQSLVSDWLCKHQTCSVRMISGGTGLNISTVHTALHAMGYRKFISRWIPHKLSDHQKSLRLSKSGDLFWVSEEDGKVSFALSNNC